jgi:hypothetical protein
MARKSFLVLLLCLQSGIMLCATVSVTAPNNSYYKEVKAILNNYKRPITVLEIGSTACCYTLPIATDLRDNAKCIALFSGDTTPLAQIAGDQKLKNVVVLNPRTLQLRHLNTLGRCEHFDVVLVHDVDSLLQQHFSMALNVFSRLGDFLFIEIPKYAQQHKLSLHFKRVASSESHQLFLMHKPKTSLDIGRFTQASIPPRKPWYHIKSTFQGKWLYKKNSKSVWIPGINLTTFIMLHGIYPSNTIIRSQFEKMKKSIPFHNDLVLKNVVVQGTTLALIDFKGKEIRHKNMQKCLDAAITSFKDKSRFRHPRTWIHNYYKVVNRDSKRNVNQGNEQW